MTLLLAPPTYIRPPLPNQKFVEIGPKKFSTGSAHR